MKIILLTNIVPPYRQRAYGMLARLVHACNPTRNPDGDFHVICTHRHEPQRAWPMLTGDFAQSILPGIKIPLGENRVIPINFGLIRALDAARPDVLILAGFGLAHWQAHLYARRNNIPTVLQFDGWAGSDATYQNRLRDCIRKTMIAHAKICIAAGENGQDWFVESGKVRNNILIAPIPPSFTAPNHLHGFDDRPVDLLWCGRPTLSKGFETFLEIAAGLHRQGHAKRIQIVGACDQNDLANRLAGLGLSKATDHMPEIPPAKLPGIYQQAKLCLLPSRNDAYGVTVIEAIACGTVALASNRVGCVPDILGTAEIPPCNIVPAWMTACARLLSDRAAWQKTQARQHSRIANNTPAHHAETILRACKMANSAEVLDA